ncbi:Phosphoadenosine phosphosulfate reductase [BD1-7 clade bacterium]|uniref:Phosphoadenosine phosphosulfate reductase n=1 Tax=BD1-7 clade bacterium TaxID=2029982 RepID=A0A5S9QRG3_9GAMM|nr:Phosphoadenosine phosphosulfate reductase [BD1-7 clade bacterium]CAA0120830.1 Phosphoadenosine phosphosulfate reductase [BD1-7 clade bacterium]
MHIGQLDLELINAELAGQSPEAIIRWALSLNKNTIMTTSFGVNSAVSLHLLSSTPEAHNVPVVWVDSGYNMRDAYLVADTLMTSLELNMRIYNPLVSAERRNAILGGIPSPDEPEFDEFVRQVKLEPFSRALDEIKPEIWISGIRKEETEHRKNLDIVSIDGRGILKVAPLFNLTEEQVDAYMQKHQLPTCKHYFDPTKIRDDAECGLHTAIA